jgi:hypothetical protein
VNPYQPPQPRSSAASPAEPLTGLGHLRLTYGIGGGLIAAPYCLLRGENSCGGDSTSGASDALLWLVALALSLTLPPLIFRLIRPTWAATRVGAGMLSAFVCALLLLLLDHFALNWASAQFPQTLATDLVIAGVVAILALVPAVVVELLLHLQHRSA